MSSSTSQARGDLGFIPNHRLHAPNRTFFGSPGNISKKGVSVPTRPPVEAIERPSELNGDAIIGKRTEWLEGQERKLTATLSEQRTEQKNLAEQVATSAGRVDELQRETSRLTAEHTRYAAMSKQMYEESQWVYGRTATKLMGIVTDKEPHKILQKYKDRKGEIDKTELAPPNAWVMLCYPMIRVETNFGHQAMMRMKSVDRTSGQLFFAWAIIFEDYEGEENRAISEFALTPT